MFFLAFFALPPLEDAFFPEFIVVRIKIFIQIKIISAFL